jgi:hypothetical protein
MGAGTRVICGMAGALARFAGDQATPGNGEVLMPAWTNAGANQGRVGL